MEIKPFFKWAGGKSKISEKILVHFKKRTRLMEPFIGSGLIFLSFLSLLSKSSFTLEDQKNLPYKAMELKEKNSVYHIES